MSGRALGVVVVVVAACISPSWTLGREDLGSANKRMPPGALLLPLEPHAVVAPGTGSFSALKEAFPWKSHCPSGPFPLASVAGSQNAAWQKEGGLSGHLEVRPGSRHGICTLLLSVKPHDNVSQLLPALDPGKSEVVK